MTNRSSKLKSELNISVWTGALRADLSANPSHQLAAVSRLAATATASHAVETPPLPSGLIPTLVGSVLTLVEYWFS